MLSSPIKNEIYQLTYTVDARRKEKSGMGLLPSLIAEIAGRIDFSQSTLKHG